MLGDIRYCKAYKTIFVLKLAFLKKIGFMGLVDYFSKLWNFIIRSFFIIVGKSQSKNNKMKHLILFGPPGSGKGTQAKQLEQKYNMIHISTGDLFRYEIGNNTALGIEAKSYMNDGNLVPDSVTIGMLKNKVNKHPEANGFIFDGFPRTIPQAEALDAFLEERNENISGLISLKVDDEEIIKRLLERGKTSGRPDDSNEGVIRDRINVYNDQTSPVYDYYDKKGTSQEVEGIGSIDDIFERLSDAIDVL